MLGWCCAGGAVQGGEATDALRAEVMQLRSENADLRTQLEQALSELEEWRSGGVPGRSPRYRSKLDSAVMLDRGVNGGDLYRYPT